MGTEGMFKGIHHFHDSFSFYFTAIFHFEIFKDTRCKTERALCDVENRKSAIHR